MNNIVSLYTSMDGRIGRKTWWLASIGLIVAVMVIEFLLLPIIGISVVPNMAALASGGDPAALSAAMADAMHKSLWASLIIYVIFAWPGIALGVKRRHDKDNNGMDVMIFWGVALLINLVGAIGLGYTTMDAGNGLSVPVPTMPLTIINVLYGIFAIYLLVVLGFLKGTAGSNQYGPDPLTMGGAVPA